MLQSRILTVEAAGKGIKFVQDTVLLDGHTVQVGFTAAYDEKDVPISSTTVVRTGKIRGQATETATLVVSADGKVLTVTTKGSGN